MSDLAPFVDSPAVQIILGIIGSIILFALMGRTIGCQEEEPKRSPVCRKGGEQQ